MKIDKKTFPANSGPMLIVDAKTGGDLLRQDDLNEQYGRRIEPDRTWTVYHVFSGVPTNHNGCAMVRLSASDASDAVTLLNARNEERRWGAARRSIPAPTRPSLGFRRWI